LKYGSREEIDNPRNLSISPKNTLSLHIKPHFAEKMVTNGTVSVEWNGGEHEENNVR
jgi:hypothetical protein